MTAKRRILLSYSMGRSSARMLALMLERYRDHPDVELLAATANTSAEDPRSLKFGAQCERYFDFPIHLVEAVVNPEPGKATTFREVGWENCTQDGSVFEDVIAKYGIPNKNYPHCNRELKLRPIHAFVQAQGWEAGSYETAIGLRADEMDRQNSRAKEERLIYPLIQAGITKPDVLRFWSKMPFDLDLPEHRGNCVWCWKKSPRKLLTLAVESPEVFDFPARMETLYPFAGAGEGPRRFFRKNWTTLDIKARARLPFKPFRDGRHERDPELDMSDGCDEACDIYAEQPAQVGLFDDLEDAA